MENRGLRLDSAVILTRVNGAPYGVRVVFATSDWEFPMYRYLALLCLLFVAACATTPPDTSQEVLPSILGTWELVDVTALNSQDSRPTGIAARKYHFTAEGTLYIVDADAPLTEDVVPIPYAFVEGVLKMTVPSLGEVVVPVEFPSPSRMVLVYSETERWTHDRMDGDRPFDRAIEPRSVQVIQTDDSADQQSNLDIDYDASDYSHLSPAARIVGVWEASSYTGVSAADWPLYGFPNYKWVFTEDGKYCVLSPSQTEMVASETVDYGVTGTTLSVMPPDEAPETVEIGFNAWGHLELHDRGVVIAFKLLSKDPNKIQSIPLKITLLDSGRHM